MLLNPCPLSTRDFTVSVGKPLMFSEASDLGFKAGEVPGAQLYDDACDVGITLTSHHTGEKTHWFQSKDLVVAGELQGWTYKPAPETLRKFPKLKGWEVHILND